MERNETKRNLRLFLYKESLIRVFPKSNTTKKEYGSVGITIHKLMTKRNEKEQRSLFMKDLI